MTLREIYKTINKILKLKKKLKMRNIKKIIRKYKYKIRIILSDRTDSKRIKTLINK